MLRKFQVQFFLRSVAQASRLCRRRLKPAATKNTFLIATPHQVREKKETLPVRQIGLFYSDKNGRATSLINITVKNSQKI
jgi:hypothetical protein